MRVEPRALLIVANSGRALAESAARGGYGVTVLDAFCDQDTRAVARCIPVPLGERGLDAERVQREAGRLAAQAGRYGLVYGAGLERAPGTLSWMSGHFTLLGNAPEVLELLADPPRFLALLDRLGICHPETRFEPPSSADGSEWLVKEAGASGGLGVRRWHDGDPRPSGAHCFQRYLEGPLLSVLFIADGSHYSLIGLNRPRKTCGGAVSPFRYGGACSGANLSPRLRAQVEGDCAGLTKALGLRGVNNLDYVLHGGRAQLLELNPRPSATLGLYEGGCPGGWMRRHVRACLGELPEVPLAAPPGVRGHLIVYAPRTLAIATGIRWPHWCHDRPPGGIRVPRGAPLCTVSAGGATTGQTERRLLARERQVLALIDHRVAEDGAVAAR